MTCAEPLPESGRSSKAVDSPEVQSLMETFTSQNHRIELTDCGVSYNNQRVKLGKDTISDVVEVLGPYDFYNGGFYVWEEAGISFANFTSRKEDLGARIDTAKIYFEAKVDERDREQLKHMLVLNKDYILFNGVPINHSTSVKDFFERSTYEFGDFEISSHSYKISTTCEEQGVVIDYFFDAIGGWNYGGGGHLRYKTDIDKNNQNLITRISVDLYIE